MKSGYFLVPILILVLVIASCQIKSKKSTEMLKYKMGKTISVPEPSGLDLTYDNKGFWTVSDETSTIYKLDGEGNVVSTIKVNGDDLEGITV
ncbi:MAG: SdiA-regulated domain-containing protein, partial [Ignavibacteriaceae bacterium]